jgi:protein required for attachment to host cells
MLGEMRMEMKKKIIQKFVKRIEIGKDEVTIE